MQIPRRNEPEFDSMEEEVEFVVNQTKELIQLAEEQSRKGCFTVLKGNDNYAMVSPDAYESERTGKQVWRLTTFDSEGFAFGHTSDSSWEALAEEAMRGAVEFVSGPPMPPYAEGTKEELLEGIASGNEQEHTTTTLLLLHGVDHEQILDARQECFRRWDEQYFEALSNYDTERAREVVLRVACEGGFSSVSLFHGTDEKRTRFDGPVFLTSDPGEAQQYARNRAAVTFVEDLIQNHPEGEIINEVLYSVLWDEGGERLTDLDATQIEEILKANDFESVDTDQMPTGTVMELLLDERKVCDLTKLGSEISSRADMESAWDFCREHGLVDVPWRDLDEETQEDLAREYVGKATYFFLENEDILESALSKHATACFTDQGLGGRSTHPTWLVRNPNEQLREAGVIVRDDAGDIIAPTQRFLHRNRNRDIRGAETVEARELEEVGEGVKL